MTTLPPAALSFETPAPTMVGTALSPTRRRAAPPALAAALLLGLLGQLLFFKAGLGINLVLWIAALALAGVWIAHRYLNGERHGLTWLLVAVGFASCVAIRASGALRALDVLAMLIALALPPLSRATRSPRLTSVFNLVRTGFWWVIHAAGLAALLPAQDVAWSTTGGRVRSFVTRFGIGVVLAGVVVVVFGSLFASADPLVGRLVQSLLDLPAPDLVGRAFATGFAAWLAAAWLRYWLVSPEPARCRERHTRGLPSGALTLPLATMVTLFAAFLGLQARWLFGGESLVLATTGLTFAEFARTGFFQMMWASGIAVPALYAAHVARGGSAVRRDPGLDALTRVQIGLVLLLVASALHRMLVYVGAYGLTESRLYGTAIITWVALATIWFGVTAARGRPRRFPFGALVGGFVTLSALNAVNPDGLIARVNLGRARQDRAVDIQYLRGLSEDAVPALAAVPEGPLSCAVEAYLGESLKTTAAADWRGWNLALVRARSAFGSMVAGRYASCPAITVTTPSPAPPAAGSVPPAARAPSTPAAQRP